MNQTALETCFYEGTLRHCRWLPQRHDFSYRLCMVWLDLVEADTLLQRRGLWSARWPAAARFHRRDYLGDPRQPLAEAVRSLIQERWGWQPRGPIRLLTNFRHAGIQMNPLSLYYCYTADGQQLEAVLAEVTNTPWNERHHYLLDLRSMNAESASANTEKQYMYTHQKDFHVSPFMGMNQEYRWELSVPRAQLGVQLEAWQQDQKMFTASLQLKREPFDRRNRLRCLLSYPLQTWKIYAAIYWQALRLWRRGIAYCPHPQHVPANNFKASSV